MEGDMKVNDGSEKFPGFSILTLNFNKYFIISGQNFPRCFLFQVQNHTDLIIFKFCQTPPKCVYFSLFPPISN